MGKKLAPLPLLPCGVYSAYQIMSQVSKLVIEEPQRLDMGWFVFKVKGKRLYDHTVCEPACGTVGCVSGWVGLLARVPNPQLHTGHTGQGVLGGIIEMSLGTDLDRLFFHTMPRTAGGRVAKIGSPSYARYVAKKVREVRDKHKVFLKARKIKISRNGYTVIDPGNDA